MWLAINCFIGLDGNERCRKFTRSLFFPLGNESLNSLFSFLVVRGYIKTLFPVGDGLSEQANVIATEVIRQENYIFVKSSKTNNEYTASINVPSGCHWKETEDRLYLLTGNLKSGRGPVLQCHIKETAWLKVLKEDILHLCSVVQF